MFDNNESDQFKVYNNDQLLNPKEVFTKTKETFNLFNEKLCQKAYDIKFSDGSSMYFRFTPSCITHALGIDYTLIKEILKDSGYPINEQTTSYDIVKILASDMNLMMAIYNFEVFDLAKMDQKASGFKSFLEMEKMRLGRIHRLTDFVEATGSFQSKNILFVVKDDNHIDAIGINTNYEGAYTYIETVLGNVNIKKYITNQKVTFPIEMIVTDDETTTIYEKNIKQLIKERDFFKMFSGMNGGHLGDTYCNDHVRQLIKCSRKVKEGKI